MLFGSSIIELGSEEEKTYLLIDARETRFHFTRDYGSRVRHKRSSSSAVLRAASLSERSCPSLASLSESPEETSLKMDEVNASAIQLNNTLSHNGQSNGTPQHPDSQTASEYAQPSHLFNQCPFIAAQSVWVAF